jgi:catechol 2,3-dioxygenase-like lactoylglutathione lyase family enzyme
MPAPVGRPHHLVVDTPDPAGLAAFYSALLGLPVTYRSDDFVVVAPSDRASGYGFQRAPDHRPPTWPDREVPQQLHLDVMVDDLAVAHDAVLALGARVLSAADHVYADPAGHPFCLVPRPGWAPPVVTG